MRPGDPAPILRAPGSAGGGVLAVPREGSLHPTVSPARSPAGSASGRGDPSPGPGGDTSAPRGQAGAEHPGAHGTPPARPSRGPRRPHPTTRLGKLGGSEGEQQSEEQSSCSARRLPPGCHREGHRDALGPRKPLAAPRGDAQCTSPSAGHGAGECRVRGCLRVSYPPCGWLRGARPARRRCRGPCGEEHTAASRKASGVQHPGPPCTTPLPCQRGQGGQRGILPKPLHSGCCVSPIPGGVMGSWRSTGGAAGRAPDIKQSRKSLSGVGGDLQARKNPCISVGVHGGGGCTPVRACPGTHRRLCTRGCARVCSCSGNSFALSVKTQGPQGRADGSAPLGAL